MKHTLFYAVAGILWLTTPFNYVQASSLNQLWSVNGLEQPESVVHDEQQDVLVVSNINGAPLELNGKGYLSRISTDGKIIDKYWVTQLNAPKGLAIHAGKLYVADMQTLHVINAKTGENLQQISLQEAKMMNDITVDDNGVVYVSDFLGGVIYQLNNDQLLPWFKSDKLPYPNGILWHDNEMLVGSWGKDIQSDFSTKTLGSLYRINPQSKQLTPISNAYQMGNLDGVISIDDDLYVSDWISGDLYHLHDNQRIKVLSKQPGLADVGVHEGVIYAPMMHDGELNAWKIVK